MAQGAAPTVPLTDNELSDPAFWLRDREHREAAFRTLRDTPGLRYFDEWVFPDSPVPAGPRLLGARPPRGRVRGQPQRRSCSAPGSGSNIGDLPVELNEFFGSMINMDDPKHFRLRSLVAKGFTPKEVAKVEELRHDEGGRRRRPHARAQPGRRVRLRRVDRRPAAAADHLRDDGHPGRRHRADLRLDERHPRRRRSRVRRHATRR